MKDIEVFWNDNLMDEIKNAASKAVRMTEARLAEELIDEITIQDLIDTGAMRASVFVGSSGTVIMSRSDAIGKATLQAQIPGKKSKRTFNFGEEIASTEWTPSTKFQGKVAISAGYAYYVNRKKQFFEKSLEVVRPLVDDIFKAEFRKIK